MSIMCIICDHRCTVEIRIGVYLLSNTTIWWIDIYIVYYIDNSYMFQHFSFAIFRLINEKLSKQL